MANKSQSHWMTKSCIFYRKVCINCALKRQMFEEVCIFIFLKVQDSDVLAPWPPFICCRKGYVHRERRGRGMKGDWSTVWRLARKMAWGRWHIFSYMDRRFLKRDPRKLQWQRWMFLWWWRGLMGGNENPEEEQWCWNFKKPLGGFHRRGSIILMQRTKFTSDFVQLFDFCFIFPHLYHFVAFSTIHRVNFGRLIFSSRRNSAGWSSHQILQWCGNMDGCIVSFVFSVYSSSIDF